MKHALIVILGASLMACQESNASFDRPAEEADIRAMLSAQDLAWNAGDIKGFMQSYLKSEDLRFASGGTIERGWQPTLERYLTRYPDRETMGSLSFTNLEIEVIDTDDALVFGHWALERSADRPSGLFTLHLKKLSGQWVIVSDHTSSAQ